MKKGIICGMVLVFMALLLLSGCVQAATNAGTGEDTPLPLAAGEEATSDPYIIINKDKQEVVLYAEVNAKYFTESTRHGIAFRGGSNGDKAILRGLGDEKVFYEAMVAVGFEPSNTLTMEDMSKSVSVEGQALEVFVSWESQEIPFADAIRASEERPMDIRFGGNIEYAKEYNSGCTLCLDSCAVGITSNAAYETGASNSIDFFGISDVLPAGGTQVKVIFRARE